MSEIHDLTAIEQRDALRRGTIGPVELVAHYLERIGRLDSGLGAFAEVTETAARERAEELAGRPPHGTLWGLPFADKDLVARRGVPTRFGSRLHRDFIPDATADAAAVLDEAGGISLGKTSTPEFGLTGYTETQIGPPARDPWNPVHGAGGSSGGAAVAVAAGLLPFAPASDGGGSIRIPSATVGVVGLKPSRGRVAVGSGLDTPGGLAVTGPIARTVADAALLLDALVDGRPLRYATRAPGFGPFLDAALRESRPARIGVTTVSPWDDTENIELDPDAARAVHTAARLLADGGHAVEEFAWQPRGYADLFPVLWRASTLQMTLTDAELELVEPITAWLVREGRELTPRRLMEAFAAATRFERDTTTAFDGFGAVLTPALALPPQPVGWFRADGDVSENFSRQVRYAPYSSFVNVSGLPALVLPVTIDTSGHPVSVQLIGRPGGEAELLALAADVERRVGELPRPEVWNS